VTIGAKPARTRVDAHSSDPSTILDLPRVER
jgi:hypothetical protein